ncbi:serine/threonine-protein kinase/endoribonuclease IRE2 [Tanacetum coccineum]
MMTMKNVLHFYGWHEESDYYHFAFEMCCVTSEDFSEAHSFTEISRAAPLRLDILTGVAKGVSSLQRKGINHGNLMPNNIFIDNHEIAKLGSCNFIFEGEKDEHKLSDQEVGVNELKLCKIVESRDLIEKILKDSEHILNQADNAPIVLAVEKECQKNKLYQTRWDTNMKDEDETIGKTGKSKLILGSQVCGGNKHNQSTEKVPTGLSYSSQGDVKYPVQLLMDQHGELFLFQKRKVHWSHKTNIDMYSLLVSDGVCDYVDAGEDMVPYSHSRDHAHTVRKTDYFAFY